MFHIGAIYRKESEGQARLCADISADGRGTTIWFGIDPAHRDDLCDQRSDAFVMALLPTAMRKGQDLSCETPMSRRLHYHLENDFVPALTQAGELYHPIRIHAPLTERPVKNKGAVGTGFTAGVDSLHTVMTHGPKSDYPLTHLAVFNIFFGGTQHRAAFLQTCRAAASFGEEMGLSMVFLDNNLEDALPERLKDVHSFRNIACAMALQGLFSQYLLSSGYSVERFKLELHESAFFDLLTVSCAQTESLNIHLAGCAMHHIQKLEALSGWEPSYRWLHSCVRVPVGRPNCGTCRKCIHNLCALYALGKLEQYQEVYDIPAFRKMLPQRLAVILASLPSERAQDTIDAMKARGISIPAVSDRMAEQFRRAMGDMDMTWN